MLCKAAREHWGKVDTSTRGRPHFWSNCHMIKMKKCCWPICPGSVAPWNLCMYPVKGIGGLMPGRLHSKEHLTNLSLMEGGPSATLVLPKWWPTQGVHQENGSFPIMLISFNFSKKIKMPCSLHSAKVWTKDGTEKIGDVDTHQDNWDEKHSDGEQSSKDLTLSGCGGHVLVSPPWGHLHSSGKTMLQISFGEGLTSICTHEVWVELTPHPAPKLDTNFS